KSATSWPRTTLRVDQPRRLSELPSRALLVRLHLSTDPTAYAHADRWFGVLIDGGACRFEICGGVRRAAVRWQSESRADGPVEGSAGFADVLHIGIKITGRIRLAGARIGDGENVQRRDRQAKNTVLAHPHDLSPRNPRSINV